MTDDQSQAQPPSEPPVPSEPPPAPPAAAPYAAAPMASWESDAKNKKLAAGITGILIGSLGIHKFVLGMTKPALIMLLVTVLTCGIGGIVMGVIGLIEGIIYLTKSDREFYDTYMVEPKKEWF